MRLTASLRDTSEGPKWVDVEQDGGFGLQSKTILRAVAQGARISKGTLWQYPFSPGVVFSLIEAAELLQADLKLDSALSDLRDQYASETAREEAIRRLIQKHADDESLPLAHYTRNDSIVPWRHQQLAYHWAIRVNSLYLAHKPGLGKTREGSDIIRGKIEHGQVRPPQQVWVPEHVSVNDPDLILPGHWAIHGGVLIICPNIVLGTWQEELKRWQNIEAPIIYGDRKRKIHRSGLAAWAHICTYDSLHLLEDNEYDGIIADEAHYLANEDTKRFGKALWVRSRARWAVALSGTPMSNMLPSLWAQYYWLDGGRSIGSSYDYYRRLYFEGTGRSAPAKEGALDAVAHRISRITYFLDMQTAFPGKPRKIHQEVRIQMTAEQREYYLKIRQSVIADIQTGTVSVSLINVKIVKLLQVCQGFVIDDDRKVRQFSSAKLTELRKMLTGDGDLTDRKTVIWVNFRHDLAGIVKMLQKAGVDCLWLHGDLNRAEREQVRDMWNTDPKWRVMVGMIQLGIGINLHAPNCRLPDGRTDRCSTTIFYGLSNRVTQVEQAMDRVYRGDQVESCLYRYLLSEDLEGHYDDDGNTLRPIDRNVYAKTLMKLEQAVELSEESVDYIRGLL